MPAFISSSHPIVSRRHPIMVNARLRAEAAVMIVGDIGPAGETIIPVLVTLDVV